VYHRPTGELLQPERDVPEAIEEMKRNVGSRIFAAQYQQNPTPPDGNMIKAAWLGRYDQAPERSSFQRVVLSCDPAGKAGAHNDYTAITIVGVQRQAFHALHVSRGHWLVTQMRDQITALAAQWQVDLVIVEDTSSGMGLIQLLKEQSRLNVVGCKPDADKETRMCRQQGRFEAGRILLPNEAPWLAEFVHELLAFPGGRYEAAPGDGSISKRRTLVRNRAKGHLGGTGRAALSNWGSPRRAAVVSRYSNRARQRPLNDVLVERAKSDVSRAVTWTASLRKF
jgi:predicted phage terminase large subunit-like protein